MHWTRSAAAGGGWKAALEDSRAGSWVAKPTVIPPTLKAGMEQKKKSEEKSKTWAKEAEVSVPETVIRAAIACSFCTGAVRIDMSATGSAVNIKSWTKGTRQRVKISSRMWATSGVAGGLKGTESWDMFEDVGLEWRRATKL